MIKYPFRLTMTFDELKKEYEGKKLMYSPKWIFKKYENIDFRDTTIAPEIRVYEIMEYNNNEPTGKSFLVKY